MRFKPVLGSFFCFITWITLARTIQGQTSNCCQGWSTTRVQIENIMNYTIQSEGLCFISAVVFYTKIGKRICSDPESVWAKKAMRKLDEMKSLQEVIKQSEQVATRDVTPATLTEAEVGERIDSEPKEERTTKNTLKQEEVTQSPHEVRQSERVSTSDVTPAAVAEAQVGKRSSSAPKKEQDPEAMEEEARQSEQVSTTDVTPATSTEAEVGERIDSDPKEERTTKNMLKQEEVTQSLHEVIRSQQLSTSDVTPAAKKDQAPEAMLKVEEEIKSLQEARQSKQVSPRDVTPGALTKAKKKTRRWRKGLKARRTPSKRCKKVRNQQRSRF